MRERFISLVKVELPPRDEGSAEARARLAGLFPRNAVRRMTHLGMLVGSVADGVALTADDAVVYATSYGETRSLEDYLVGFPTPSPLLFQTSIHPSAVQQVLIGRQQPVARLWPCAGRRRLVEHALQAALLEPARRVWLTGGEERGTWLLERGVASERSFAFGLMLEETSANPLGRVSIGRSAGENVEPPTLEQFAEAAARRESLSWQSGAHRWEVEWR